MKSILLLVVALLPFYSTNAQTWYKQVIRNEVTISFPIEPQHKIVDNKGKETYMSYTEGCGFMVGITPDINENYDNYLKASDSEQIAMALHTLEGVAGGKISSGNQHLISMKSFRSNKKYVGLDVAYMTLEPSDPESRKRFSTLLLVKNTLYIFDCWYMDAKDHSIEKDKFFKSILLKD